MLQVLKVVFGEISIYLLPSIYFNESETLFSSNLGIFSSNTYHRIDHICLCCTSMICISCLCLCSDIGRNQSTIVGIFSDHRNFCNHNPHPHIDILESIEIFQSWPSNNFCQHIVCSGKMIFSSECCMHRMCRNSFSDIIFVPSDHRNEDSVESCWYRL